MSITCLTLNLNVKALASQSCGSLKTGSMTGINPCTIGLSKVGFEGCDCIVPLNIFNFLKMKMMFSIIYGLKNLKISKHLC